MNRLETKVTLRSARGQAGQQAAIDAWASEHETAPGRRAVIAEGAFFDLVAPPGAPIERIAAGCVCCVGLVPLRVVVTRVLRTVRPDRLLLLVADDAHLDRIRTLLATGGLGAPMEESP